MEYKLLLSIYEDYKYFSKIFFVKLKIISNNINDMIIKDGKFYKSDKYNKLNELHKEYSEEYMKIINEQIYIKNNKNINDTIIKKLLKRVEKIKYFLYKHNEGKQLLC